MLKIVHHQLYQHINGFNPIILVYVFHVCTVKFLININLIINVHVPVYLVNNVNHQVIATGQVMNVIHKFVIK